MMSRVAASGGTGSGQPNKPRAAIRPDPVEFLTGRWPGWQGATEPDGVRTPWPKFDASGQALPFPGVTIVCHVPQDSATFQALVAIQDTLKAAPFAEHFSYLPPSSFHMTLFDVSNEERRGTDAWPKGVPPDATWSALSDEIDARVEGLTFPTPKPRAAALYAGFSVVLEGADAVAEEAMRQARDNLRDRTGVNRADHNTYIFHITLAYPLRFVSDDVAQSVVATSERAFEAHKDGLNPIALGPSELCDFEDMYAFVPRRVLG